MDRPAQDIADVILSGKDADGKRLIDKDMCHLAYELAKAVKADNALYDEIARLEVDAARYRHVRTLSVAKFNTLWRGALHGEITFDELVDQAISEKLKGVE